VAERFIGRPWERQVLDELIALADHVRLDLQVFVQPPLVQRVGVEQAGLRIERGVRPVFSAASRGPMFGRLARTDALGDVGLDWPTGLLVDVARPVHLLERICRQQFPVGAVDHVEEAVAVELHDHLAFLAANVDVGVDQFPASIVVVGIIGRELVVPRDLASRRPHREQR
jgi:hypothetical protein